MAQPENKLYRALTDAGIAPQALHPNAPMSRYTSFRIGGPADLLMDTATPENIAVALRIAREENVPILWIGNGSNLLVRDGGIRGLVLRIASTASHIQIVDQDSDRMTLSAFAGISLASLAAFALAQGLCGLAELSGIPGTLGGGALMNAGAYGASLSDVIQSVEGVRFADGAAFILSGDALCYDYRTSALMDMDAAITRVTLSLPRGDATAIGARMRELAIARREKQPLELPSAGSTFKRPHGDFAARLIDACGLKGLSVGGAQVSEKHAGFIVNRGGATASDVLSLMQRVQERVLAETGVQLEPEIRIVGEDAWPREGGSA